MKMDYFNATKHSDKFRYDDNDTTVTFINKFSDRGWSDKFTYVLIPWKQLLVGLFG